MKDVFVLIEEAIEKSTDEVLHVSKQLQLIPFVSTIHSFYESDSSLFLFSRGLTCIFDDDEIEGQLLQEKVWRALEEL